MAEVIPCASWGLLPLKSSGALRPPIDVIKAMDITVPGICAHEAALTGRWVDVPLFEW